VTQLGPARSSSRSEFNRVVASVTQRESGHVSHVFKSVSLAVVVVSDNEVLPLWVRHGIACFLHPDSGLLHDDAIKFRSYPESELIVVNIDHVLIMILMLLPRRHGFWPVPDCALRIDEESPRTGPFVGTLLLHVDFCPVWPFIIAIGIPHCGDLKLDSLKASGFMFVRLYTWWLYQRGTAYSACCSVQMRLMLEHEVPCPWT
jgi:hypothetical protein